MAQTILKEVKTSLGISVDNLGFDIELLLLINSVKVNLVQLGVDEFDITIDEDTAWPVTAGSLVDSLSKHYILTKVKQSFDPTASETISKVMSENVVELAGRITHEVEEIANAP